MVELAELEAKYDYTVEFDDGTEYVHIYFASVIDFESPSFLRFDPVYELGNGIEKEVRDVTVMIPYEKVFRIIKRKEPD